MASSVASNPSPATAGSLSQILSGILAVPRLRGRGVCGGVAKVYDLMQRRLFFFRLAATSSLRSSSASLLPSGRLHRCLIAVTALTHFCIFASLLPRCHAQTEQQLASMAAGTGYPPSAAVRCRNILCAVLVTPVFEDWKEEQQLLKTAARGDGPKDAAAFKEFMLRILTLSGNARNDKPLRISGLISYLEKHPKRFFTRILPLLASVALHINDLFPDGLPFLTAVTNPELHLRKTQVFGLLAVAFLGVLPHNQKALLIAAAPSLTRFPSGSPLHTPEVSGGFPESSSSSSSLTSRGRSSLPAALATFPITRPLLTSSSSSPAVSSPAAAAAAAEEAHEGAAQHAAAADSERSSPAAHASSRSPPAVSSSSSCVYAKGSGKFCLNLNKLDMHYRGFFERLPKFEALLMYFDAMERRLSKCWREIIDKKHFHGPPPCSAACPCFSPSAEHEGLAAAAVMTETSHSKPESRTGQQQQQQQETAGGGGRRDATKGGATAAAAGDMHRKGRRKRHRRRQVVVPLSDEEERRDEEHNEHKEDSEDLRASPLSSPAAAAGAAAAAAGPLSEVDSIIGFYRHSRARSSFSQLFHGLSSYQTVRIDEETLASSQQALAPLRVLPTGDITMSDGALMVDFADRFVGGLSMFRSHIAQEEYLFIVFPELHVVMLFNDVLGEDEAIVIKGIERFVFVSGYEGGFRIDRAATPEAVHPQLCMYDHHCHTQGIVPFDKLGRSDASVVAMDALDFSRIETQEQFSVRLINRELLKAAVGFKGDPYEPEVHKTPQPVASGWWGCTVFGGDARLKTLLQWLAASLAGRKLLFFTFGSSRIPHMQTQVNAIAKKYKTVQSLYNALIAAVEQQGASSLSDEPHTYMQHDLSSAYWLQGYYKSRGEALWKMLIKG